MIGQHRIGQRRHLADGAQAQRVQPLLAFGADAPQPADRQRGQGTSAHLVRLEDDDRPSGLRRSLASLARNLFGRDADRGRQPRLGADAVLDLPGDLRRRAEQPLAAAHVEERLVQAERLDQGRERKKDFADLAGDLRRSAPCAPAGRRRRGQSRRAVTVRHGAVDAERAGLVGGGADHAAALRLPPTMTGRPRSSGRSRCSTDA